MFSYFFNLYFQPVETKPEELFDQSRSVRVFCVTCEGIKLIYQATACSRRPPRDRTLALALLYVSLSLKPQP